MDEAKSRRNRKTSTGSEISFEHCTIVACGTLSLELNHLKKSGFLNARRIEYTKPGRHEVPRELEQQLVERIARAKSQSEAVIVVYGGKFCFIDMNDPARTIDHVIEEQGKHIARIDATHCVDMLADREQAVVLDPVGFWDDYSARHPEKLLDFSDWMGIPIRPQNISLTRLKTLLSECAARVYRTLGSDISWRKSG